MIDADSTLAFALLGLIWQQPQSGYDLRKFFATTPMISFSDSPGAIYPALARLARRGLIRGVADTRDARGRTLFHLTPRGRAAFQKWQNQPVTREDVVRHMGTLMLRFAFMDQSASPADALSFLEELQRELASYIPTLRAYLKRFAPGIPLSGRLALESGIRGYETHLRWTKSAAAAYRSKGKQP